MYYPNTFHAETMGIIMYFYQTLEQPDAREFMKALLKELNGYTKNKRWKLIDHSQVPKDVNVISSVWSMQCKYNLFTNKVTKYESRVNKHGEKQVYEINYFKTYLLAMM
jgi:hypothetical protein